MKTTLKVASVEDFFSRGVELARRADRGESVPCERIIAFEAPEDLARLVTTAKLVLLREVKACPGSITDLSQRLHRDRSAVKRDVDALQRVGLLEINTVTGHSKQVRAVADQVLLAI